MKTTVQTHEELYAEVLRYYAHQMQLLDERDLQGYADTFTEDGEFEHTPGREPARTREGILLDLVEFHRQFETDPMKRRHHFSMVDVEIRDDGAVVSTAYALVIIVRPGQKPEIRASCVVHDVLVRVGGELRNRSRRVEID